ncbi:MAG TPA: NAD(P)-dependent oxidoreductase, partial [Thermoanaerobaculia bacterium]|nr:NAD(P)-dependent oxidoreductase [Thermoanaerobaculia bacterium]
MKPTVVLTAAFPRVARDLLADDFEIVEHPTEQSRTEEEMITILGDADGAITLLSDPLTRRVLASNPNLAIVANFAVGYNNVDVDAARELGIVVTNTPGVLTEATADLTMALMLAVMRRIVEGDAEVRSSGRCEWEPLTLLGASLHGKRLGIAGMGRIGTAVGARAEAFGMEIVHHSRRSGIPLDELLETSDVVSLHLPLSDGTRRIIDRTALGRMKQGSYLINTSRGPLVDEEALCDALEAGRLRG